MARRLQLHEELCAILGSRKVYFQPPESMKIEYPAIIYKVIDRNDLKADDRRYRAYVKYEVSFISRDPDSTIPDTLLDSFKYIMHTSSYTAGNMHHDIFTLSY